MSQIKIDAASTNKPGQNATEQLLGDCCAAYQTHICPKLSYATTRPVTPGAKSEV